MATSLSPPVSPRRILPKRTEQMFWSQSDHSLASSLGMGGDSTFSGSKAESLDIILDQLMRVL